MTDQNDVWYLQHSDGQSHGPYSLSDLVEAAKIGNIAAESLVHHPQHTQGQWVSAARIRPIGAAMKAQTPELTTSQPAASVQRTPQTTAPQQPNPEPVSSRAPTVSVKSAPVRSRREMQVPKTFVDACFAIFDFRFKYYITPWIVRIQWALFVAFVVGLFAFVFYGYVISPIIGSMSSVDEVAPVRRSAPSWEFSPPRAFTGTLAKVLGILSFAGACAAALLYVRLILESVIVFFRIAEDLAVVRQVAEKE